MIDFAAARRMMVDGQVRTSDVTDLRIIAAMLELPRERFVPAASADLAYLVSARQAFQVICGLRRKAGQLGRATRSCLHRAFSALAEHDAPCRVRAGADM